MKHRTMLRSVPITVLCIILFPDFSEAQDVNFTASTIHDENIFDIYVPTSDRVTQFMTDVSKSWDTDRAAVDATYTGALSLFRDLNARNYHVHLIAVTTTYHLSTHDAEEEEEDAADPIESGDGADTLDFSPGVPPRTEPEQRTSPDSLDQLLIVAVSGGIQLDKNDFSQFDNSKIRAELACRQPVGLLLTARPSYALTYHDYPNLPGLTNFENILALSLGKSVFHTGWISLTPAYGIKKYTSSTYTYTFTPRFSNPTGHGKVGGGNGRPVSRSIVLTTPSVNQFSTAISWNQKFSSSTTAMMQYTYYGTPTSEARLLPQEKSNAFERVGIGNNLVLQNEIFDDRYGYSGNEVSLRIQQQFPFALMLTMQGTTLHKNYTLDALAFDSTATETGRRIDTRLVTEINLSRPIALSEHSSLRPQLEVHLIRNESNAPYYEFDKATFMIGLEFNF
ncbi:MAG TPA: hypothetical protein VGR15_02580 [Bacteroidota bacterium]|nr:hypothetical protein [Bacteroidota bacterium]